MKSTESLIFSLNSIVKGRIRELVDLGGSERITK